MALCINMRDKKSFDRGEGGPENIPTFLTSFMDDPFDSTVFLLAFQAVELGIALLEGGHQEIQKSLFNLLQSGDLSQSFFHVFHEKMNDAQMEIKSTVTVNTTDIAARATEDSKDPKDVEKAMNNKKRGSKYYRDQY